MKNNNEFFERVSLILFDEYQEYQPTLNSIKEIISKNDDTLMIGCTATPHEEDCLTTAYSYTRLQAIKDGAIAPVIADSLGVNFNTLNLSKFITALPTILKNQPHPGFPGKNTLNELKGVIYLPSVEKCDLAKIQLERAGIKCFCIHSRNPNYKSELRTFLMMNEPIVVLAVRMMRIGYDDKNLAWIIIAQKTLIKDISKKCMIEQIMGRVMRKNDDKIGYVLSFKDTYQDFLLPLTRNQVLNHPLSMDYLASDLAYGLSNDGCFVYDAGEQSAAATFAFEIRTSTLPASNIKMSSADERTESRFFDVFESDKIETFSETKTEAPFQEDELIAALIERPLLHYYKAKKLNDNFADFKILYSELEVSTPKSTPS